LACIDVDAACGWYRSGQDQAVANRPFHRNLKLSSEPTIAASTAGLHYVTDASPGIVRRTEKDGTFCYFDSAGKPIRNLNTLDRIRRLAIPPAWRDVWICPDAAGHLQASGRDARRRKQYRYHSDWRRIRDQTKYDRLITFGRALPKIRLRVSRDLARLGLPREKVLATIVRLLETTLVRIGNDEYARDNNSYGLTTLRNRHAEVRASTMTFKFRGKSGRKHILDVRSRRLAKIVKHCRDLPGYKLFQYIDESGTPIDVTSNDVNDYLREISGSNFTAKDFRTWAGTVLAARALQQFEKCASQTEAKTNLLRAIESVARMLGNTPAICRRCYVHPVVIDSYLEGSLIEQLTAHTGKRPISGLRKLRLEESAVLMLLQESRSRGNRKTP
jgi:DNA topoisomerase-1